MAVPDFKPMFVPVLQITADGERLGELMIEYDIGVSRDQTFVLKKIDADYYEEA